MLSVGGERLLRALARSVYRKLKAILPEHEKEIQAYQDGLHVFRRNIMVEPDFVEPLAANYPEKNKLMVELRLLYKISHIWNTVGSILFVLAFACLLYLLIS